MVDDKDRTVVEFPEKRGPDRPKGAKDRVKGSARRKAASFPGGGCLPRNDDSIRREVLPLRSCQDNAHALLLALLDISNDSANVVIEPRGMLLTHSAHFFNDGVRPHVHSPMSSSGVQMIGSTNPSSEQTLRMALWSKALAMCLQFQVNK